MEIIKVYNKNKFLIPFAIAFIVLFALIIYMQKGNIQGLIY